MDLPTHFILDKNRRVKPTDVLTWARTFENADRQVALDYVGEICVSTVFTGIALPLSQVSRILVFETRIFGGALDGETDDYASWDEAVAGHAAVLARVIGVREQSR